MVSRRNDVKVIRGESPQALRLIVLFLTGPVAWTLFFMAGYLYVEAGCSINTAASASRWVIPVMTLITVAVTGMAARQSLQMRNVTSPSQERQIAIDPQERTRFVAGVTFASSLIFILLDLMTGAAAVYLQLC